MKKEGWSPYIAGGLTGIVAMLSVWISGEFLGASTTFARSAGMIEKICNAERVAHMDYFIKYVPKVDWQFMLLIGIFFGALIAAVTSDSFRWQAVPDMWKARFGSSITKRAVVAFLGGVIAIFGARLADGCPSGHGLSGLMQLSISGYISLICFFIGGLVVARCIYRGGERP